MLPKKYAFQFRWLALFISLGTSLSLWGCAASPFDAFVVSKNAGKLTVLNFDTDRQLLAVEGSPFDVGAGATDVTYDPRHRRVYVTNSADNTLSVFKMKRVTESYFKSKYILDRLEAISTEEEPVAAAVDSTHGLVLILHRDGTLVRLDGRDLSLKDKINVFYAVNPYPDAVDIAYDVRNDLIYVIDAASGILLILEGRRLEYVDAVKTATNPCSLCYDYRNERIYITDRGDELASRVPSFSVYRAGRFCSLLQEIPLDVPYSCSEVVYDEVHNLIFVSKGLTRVYDAESLEFRTEISTSLPYSLATGFIDGASPSLLYIGQTGSVEAFEIKGSDQYVRLGHVSLPAPATKIDGVYRIGCPEIISLSSPGGRPGDTVTILGLNFGDNQGLSRVEFGGIPALERDIVLWSDTKIEVNVPLMGQSGPVRVVVGNCSTAPPDGEDIKEFTVIPGKSIYVNAREGSNRGNGTEISPYRTITYALSKADPSDKIFIHWGRYTRDLGERFPLRVNAGVHLEGCEEYVEIEYSSPGNFAIEMAEGSSLKKIGVYVEEGEAGEAVPATGIICRGNVRVEDAVVTGFRRGISLESGFHKEISPVITESDISACDTGIYVYGNVNAKMVDNSLFNNRIAIEMAGNSNYVASNDLWDNLEAGITAGGHTAFLLGNMISNTLDPDQTAIGQGIIGGLHTNSFFYGNHLSNNHSGLSLFTMNGYRYVIRDNTFNGNRREGLYLPAGGEGIVLGNRFEWSQTGIYLIAEHSIFERNTIAHNQDGLLIMKKSDADSLETTLVGNYVTDNTRYGVKIMGTLNDQFEETVSVRIGQTEGDGNTITGNGTGVSSQKARLYLFNNIIESNQYGVEVHDAGYLQLGSDIHPGNNVIRNNIHIGLANNMHRLVHAEGNTWNPDIQGADSEGHYAPQTVRGPVEPQDGNNFSIASQHGQIQF